MSECTNCYNGCVDIISDKCVKYTGLSNEELDLNKGDNLQVVITKITDYITNSSYIATDYDVCSLVRSYLPQDQNITLSKVIEAIIKSICHISATSTADLTTLTNITQILTNINSGYIANCLTTINTTSDLKTVIQAIINKLCTIDLTWEKILNKPNVVIDPVNTGVPLQTLTVLQRINLLEQSLKKRSVSGSIILSNSDYLTTIFVNNGANNVTVAIPNSLNQFEVGIIQMGTGNVTIIGELGVAITNPIGYKIAGQGYPVYIEKVPNTANNYILLGNTKV